MMEVAKSMIHDQYLPMYLWEEGAKPRVYVQKKIPILILETRLQKRYLPEKSLKQSPKDIWLTSIHTHSQGEKIKARSFRK